jgi:hypothetical protein
MEKFLRTKYGIDLPAGAEVENFPKKEVAA